MSNIDQHNEFLTQD
jgi:hypothetical protein